MTGLRTTLPEVTGWVEGNSHRVFVASMEDRFGEMGVISILLVDFGDVEEVSIDAFVLSCRVFGSKAEDVILNEVKRRAIANGKQRIAGLCRHIAVNGPCQSVYADNGFGWEDERWVYDLSSGVGDDPEWLEIKAEGRY